MSFDPRAAPGGPGRPQQTREGAPTALVGSVRKARERIESGLPPGTKVLTDDPEAREALGLPSSLQAGGRNHRGYGGGDRGRPPPPSPLALRLQAPSPSPSPSTSSKSSSSRWANPGAIGASISRPAPAPSPAATQRSFQSDRRSSGRRLNNSPTQDTFQSDLPSRLKTPPLPSHISSLMGPPRIPDPNRLTAKSVNQAGDEGLQTPRSGLYPPLNTPAAFSTHVPSVISSRQSTASSTSSIPDFPVPNATPARKSFGPPSSRRGYSSYYSQSSFHPIPEEASGSFSSGNGVPSGWNSPLPPPQASGLDEAVEDEEEPSADGATQSPTSTDGDERDLVRHASLGQRHRPSLTTIRTYERESSELEMPRSMPRSTESLSAQFNESDSAERESQSQGSGAETSGLTAAAAAPAGADFGTAAVMKPKPLARAGMSRPANAGSARGAGPDDAYFGFKRPPPLNMDAVKAAEARGSLTSLPDLIRRATTLASVLDRGRPASRMDMGFNWPRAERGNEKVLSVRRSGGSLTDLLASFPPPGLATPGSDARDTPPVYRSGRRGSSSTTGSLDKKFKPVPARFRRYCGIPLWILVTLGVAMVVITAAVVIPLTVVVLPRQHDNDVKAQLASCQTNVQCANGGQNSFDTGVCGCVCSGGYTGDRCTVPPDNGCSNTTVTNLSGGSQNATLGSAIPRLLQVGQSQFNIPLNGSQILAGFTTANASCPSENALVTFNGRSDRNTGGASSTSAAGPTVTPHRKRQDIAGLPTVISAPASLDPEATSNGIIFASPTASPVTAPLSSPTATALFVDEDTLDFARVGMLYILQEKSMNIATSAQQTLSTSLGATLLASANVSAGNGITLNFKTFAIDLGNGVVGVGAPT
ncbi:MAG: hypothetical protein M1838_003170 [Thelocarpon superellum]|nr:MAG: hypothetical protein M1838_003170 [Thelocarpon superellum]